MKTRDLTPKQQVKARARVFNLLLAMGFQFEADKADGFYWRKVRDGGDTRVCVGYGVLNHLSQRCDKCWAWQEAKLNEAPLFGYSGTTSCGASFGTVEHVLDITFECFWAAGIAHYSTSAQARIAEAKGKIAAALTLIQNAL